MFLEHHEPKRKACGRSKASSQAYHGPKPKPKQVAEAKPDAKRALAGKPKQDPKPNAKQGAPPRAKFEPKREPAPQAPPPEPRDWMNPRYAYPVGLWKGKMTQAMGDTPPSS